MRLLLMALLFLCITYNLYANDQNVEAITDFKTDSYLGNWYEIARIPFYFEKDCVAPIMANYALDDDKLSVINTCRTKNGETETAFGEAVFVESSNVAKLKVTFLPGWLRFTKIGRGDYWVLYTDYQYSLVGSPDHKYLWILSRSEITDGMMIVKLLNIARKQGFDIKLLQFNYKMDDVVVKFIDN